MDQIKDKEGNIIWPDDDMEEKMDDKQDEINEEESKLPDDMP